MISGLAISVNADSRCVLEMFNQRFGDLTKLLTHNTGMSMCKEAILNIDIEIFAISSRFYKIYFHFEIILFAFLMKYVILRSA